MLRFCMRFSILILATCAFLTAVHVQAGEVWTGPNGWGGKENYSHDLKFNRNGDARDGGTKKPFTGDYITNDATETTIRPYKNGKAYGNSITYNARGKIVEVSPQNKKGKIISYHPNGKISHIIPVKKDGAPDGNYFAYYLGGKTYTAKSPQKKVTYYPDGKTIKSINTYDKSGAFIKQEKYTKKPASQKKAQKNMAQASTTKEAQKAYKKEWPKSAKLKHKTWADCVRLHWKMERFNPICKAIAKQEGIKRKDITYKTVGELNAEERFTCFKKSRKGHKKCVMARKKAFENIAPGAFQASSKKSPKAL